MLELYERVWEPKGGDPLLNSVRKLPGSVHQWVFVVIHMVFIVINIKDIFQLLLKANKIATLEILSLFQTWNPLRLFLKIKMD